MQASENIARVPKALVGTLLIWLSAAVRAEEAQPPQSLSAAQESLSHWAYCAEVQLPKETSARWIDFVLPPMVFDKSRRDLLDLRLCTQDGKEVPYDLRVRAEASAKEPLPARPFNLTHSPDGASEVSLDLERNDREHNEIEVELPGINYRRRIELLGCDDGSKWSTVLRQELIHFQRGKQTLRDTSISYPPCRNRYLRLRVFADPEVDQEPVNLDGLAISVLRTIEIPGETSVWPAKEVGPRQPSRVDGEPGSEWMITLGGDKSPVDRIEVTIRNREFVRNFRLEAAGPVDSNQRFSELTSGVWRRKVDETPQPMVASFAETHAARVRLVVADYLNKRLDVERVVYSAPARQVVFAKPAGATSLRLYFGNPDAARPEYDFARNLPEKLDPEPARAKLAPGVDNPEYVPKPVPLTERLPWLIYVVLSAVILVLGAILLSLSRAAIRSYDRASLAAAGQAIGPNGFS